MSPANIADGAACGLFRYVTRRTDKKNLSTVQPMLNATIVMLHIVSPRIEHMCETRAVNGRCVCTREHHKDALFGGRRMRNLRNFESSIPAIDRTLRTKYPITLFRDENQPHVAQDLRRLRSMTHRPVLDAPLAVFNEHFFQGRLRREFANLTDNCLVSASCGRSFAYKQMNYVFIYGMFFDSDALAPFDYWMRIDADSVVRFAADPFHQLHITGTNMLYQGPFRGGGCTQGLNEEMERYVAAHGIRPTEEFRNALRHEQFFYGNLMAGNLDTYRTPNYRHFASHFISSLGVWRHRWDDQHILCYALNLFWPGTGDRIRASNAHA